MVVITVLEKFGNCHKCGVEDILDEDGLCVRCFDNMVDHPKSSVHKREWDRRYYQSHRELCIQRSVEAHRRKRIQHPELKIRDREYQRAYRKKNQHLCVKCGHLCNQRSIICLSCYRELLRIRFTNQNKVIPIAQQVR